MDPIYESYKQALNEAKSITIKDISIPEYLGKLKKNGVNFELKKTKAEDWEIGVLNDILNTAADAPKNKRTVIKQVIGYLAAYGKPYTYMEEPSGAAKLFIYDKQGKEAVVIS